jgi:polysaccharide chain length determinant protein (PEP-CTERM system associated)
MSQDGRGVSGFDAIRDIAGRRGWLGLAVFAVITSGAVAGIRAIPDVYRSTATVLVERDRVSEAFVRSSVTAELETRLSTISQELLSRARLEALIVQFGLYPEMRAHAPLETVVERMRRDIRLEPKSVEQTSGRPATIAFSISYRGREPQVVADVTNTLASVSVDENTRMREQQATGTAQLLAREVEEMKKRLAEDERHLREFRSRHSGQLPEQLSLNLTTIDRLNGQLQLIRNSLSRALEHRTSLARQLADAEGTASAAGPSGAPRGLEPDAGGARLVKLRQELRALRARFTDRYPDIARLKAEIAQLEQESDATHDESAAAAPAETGGARDRTPPIDPAVRRLRMALEDADREIEASRAESDQLVKQIAAYQERAERAAPIEQEFQTLSRDYGATKERYFALTKRYEEAVLAETMEQRQPREQFRVLDAAIPGSDPVAPNRLRLTAVAVALSILSAGAVMIIAEQIGLPFHHVDSLRAFTGVPILASIPVIVTAVDRRRAALRFWLTTVSVAALALIVVKLSSLFGGTELIVGILTKGTS